MPSEKKEVSTMYAIKYTSTSGGIEQNFEVKKDAPRPPPLKDGETLVQVTCAALNPVDYKFPEVPLVGRLAIGLPATPGIDYAGIVTSTKHAALTPGQRVFGRLGMPTKFGVLAEYTVAPSGGCAALPDSLSFAQGAAIGTAGLTAWAALAPYVQDKPAGQRVFVNGGSGGVGTYAVQIAKALGCHVVATCSSRNTAFVKGLGADDVIEYDKLDVCKTLGELVNGDASNVFDLAVDNVGSPAQLYKAADHYLKDGGTFVQVGAIMSASGTLTLGGRAMKPAVLGGGKRKWVFVAPENKKEDFEALADLIVQGKMKSIIDETFAFGDARAAYEKVKTGRAKGKVLVNVRDA